MKAARIHKFGPPEVIVVDDIPRPSPDKGEMLIRVAAAGVGPWDALIREKKSQIEAPLPITLGSDLSGTVEEIGPDVSGFSKGEEIYGVTNPQFIGAYAEYAIVSAGMVGPKPEGLSMLQAASVPVVAVTALQMLIKGEAQPGAPVLVLGGAGNVGAYAVQIAGQSMEVFATASAKDLDYVKSLGASEVLDYRAGNLEDQVPKVDLVLDTVGGETRNQAAKLLKPGGSLVSVVSPFSEDQKIPGIRSVFFLVEVTTERLETISGLFDRGLLVTQVGTVLPLSEARAAHEMLAGAPHQRGKILLTLDA